MLNLNLQALTAGYCQLSSNHLEFTTETQPLIRETSLYLLDTYTNNLLFHIKCDDARSIFVTSANIFDTKSYASFNHSSFRGDRFKIKVTPVPHSFTYTLSLQLDSHSPSEPYIVMEWTGLTHRPSLHLTSFLLAVPQQALYPCWTATLRFMNTRSWTGDLSPALRQLSQARLSNGDMSQFCRGNSELLVLLHMLGMSPMPPTADTIQTALSINLTSLPRYHTAGPKAVALVLMGCSVDRLRSFCEFIRDDIAGSRPSYILQTGVAAQIARGLCLVAGSETQCCEETLQCESTPAVWAAEAAAALMEGLVASEAFSRLSPVPPVVSRYLELYEQATLSGRPHR